MKKIVLIAILLVSFISLGAFAAKYKVNTSGKVTNQNGQVQQSSVLQTQPLPQINTYSSQTYTSQKIVLSQNAPTIDIVMDYSGSMSNWIEAAKNAMSIIVSQVPTTTKIGFRTFGQNSGNNPYSPIVEKAKTIIKGKNGKYKAVARNSTSSFLGNTTGYCSATQQVVPVTTYNSATLINGMNSTRIGGSTPLTYSLYQAVNQDFANFDRSYTKKIVLITDGGENCGGDPCAFVKNLVNTRKDIIIDVVLVSSYSTKLSCLTTTTGGKFYYANSPLDFSNAIVNSVSSTTNQTTKVKEVPQEQTQQYEYIK